MCPLRRRRCIGWHCVSCLEKNHRWIIRSNNVLTAIQKLVAVILEKKLYIGDKPLKIASRSQDILVATDGNASLLQQLGQKCATNTDVYQVTVIHDVCNTTKWCMNTNDCKIIFTKESHSKMVNEIMLILRNVTAQLVAICANYSWTASRSLAENFGTMENPKKCVHTYRKSRMSKEVHDTGGNVFSIFCSIKPSTYDSQMSGIVVKDKTRWGNASTGALVNIFSSSQAPLCNYISNQEVVLFSVRSLQFLVHFAEVSPANAHMNAYIVVDSLQPDKFPKIMQAYLGIILTCGCSLIAEIRKRHLASCSYMAYHAIVYVAPTQSPVRGNDTHLWFP